MGDSETISSRRAYKKAMEKETLFRRAELFHKELMEDFRFMEAARMHSGEYEAANLDTSHLKPHNRFKELMVTNPHGLINFAAYAHKRSEDKSTRQVVEADMRSLRFQTRMASYPPLDIFAHWILNTSFFTGLMVVVILVNSVLIAVDIDQDQGSKSKEQRRALENLDFFFLGLFVAEIILKWMDNFREFWKEGWNIFDFFVTATSLIAPFLDIVLQDKWKNKEEDFETLFQVVKYLRIIRIFRSLNVVTRIHKIRLIWEAVVKTFRELIFITALMLIFFYIFAIIGIKLFDRYTSSHAMNLNYRHAFRSLPMAFVTLFQLFTLDHYDPFMTEIGEVMGKIIPCTYIILWVFLGSFMFRNIFTGVMVNNFQNIRLSLLEEENSIESNKNLAIELNIFGDDDPTEPSDSPSDTTIGSSGDKEKKAKGEDPHLGWEDEVFHNLQIMQALGGNLSPTVWPRDTLFQYYMLLEAISNNIEEKNSILRLLDHAVIRHFDE